MANLKNAADNGALITLGLVGVVAVAGAVAKRGVGSMAPGSMARSRAQDAIRAMHRREASSGKSMAGNMRIWMSRIRDHLNNAGFSFEEMDTSLLVDDGSHLSIRRDGGMVEVAKRIEDRDGNLVSMKTLGEFDLNDLSGIEAAARRAM